MENTHIVSLIHVAYQNTLNTRERFLDLIDFLGCEDISAGHHIFKRPFYGKMWF